MRMVRPFTLADYDAAFRLWQVTPGVGLSSADSREAIAQFLERNPGLSFAVGEGDELVGTVLCGHDGRRGLIHHLAVATTHRRRGIGRELARAALHALHGAGIAKCHLLVFRDNAEAQEFWRSVGAEQRVELQLFSASTS
jgi:N-acetylglutamate synthase